MATKVHVHLDHGRDAENWRTAFESGKVANRYVYGYEYAADRVDLSQSSDRRDGRIGAFARKVQRRILGFDLAHAWWNREAFRQADVIWTHTEYEWLAVAVAQRLPRGGDALLLAQSVWLWDRWRSQGLLRRTLARALVDRVALHTTLSPQNAESARAITRRSVQFVPFGIEPFAPVDHERQERPVVIAPGNDRDRDWGILLAAAAARPGIDFLILSRTFDLPFGHLSNVAVISGASRAELATAYRRASAVLVPLHANGHASGVTVALEAVSAGLPVVATDVGGLRAYLDGLAELVPEHDVDALTAALDRAVDVERSATGAEVLRQQRLTARDYADRHVELTRLLLSARTAPDVAGAGGDQPEAPALR